ncbi:MAG: DNA helicase RecQ [Fidelibacterota bacterium]
MNTQHVLKNVFGFTAFRDNQEAIIQSIINKNDTLIIMPTGSGKSLCYQIPALIFDGLTVVISPLISLMKDQVGQLQEYGVKAVFLNSSLPYQEYNKVIAELEAGKIKLLYVAPETLLLPRTVNLLKGIPVDCFAVDEAHCISEWGHDFRPEYRKIADLTREFKDVVVVGATATATPVVQHDIVMNLKLRNPQQFVSSFDRKNLFLEVRSKDNQVAEMMNFIQQFPNESGLIYCFSRKQVDRLAEFLQSEGLSAKPYHAGLSDHERKENQELFIKDDVQIVVATVAFGMGIDKPNIRYVIHNDLPKDIETYYQQIGRAGRDGLDSHCLLFFSYGDVGKIKYFIGEKEGQQQKIAYNHLEAMLDFCETHECRRKSLLEYFGEEYTGDNCAKCDNCAQETKDLVDLTVPAQKFLSCIKRVDEMFGANHIIDVLRGSKNKKVLQRGHDRLSTYAIGKDLTKKQWLQLSRQLMRENYIYRDEMYGSLRLNENSWQILKDKEKFLGKLQFDENKKITKEPDYDAELFDILRRKRKKIADASNMPPYIIFSDRSLVEMAQYYPQSEGNFKKINGVGDYKFNKYGQLFMSVIADYCQENDIDEKKKYTIPAGNGNKKRHIEVGEMFNQGAGIEEIMQHYQVQAKTVIKHLHNFIQEGHRLNHSIAMPEEINDTLRQKIFKSFDTHGPEFLKPVFTDLNESVDYDLLHYARLIYIVDKMK